MSLITKLEGGTLFSKISVTLYYINLNILQKEKEESKIYTRLLQNTTTLTKITTSERKLL